jgi:zinc transporter ZupT
MLRASQLRKSVLESHDKIDDVFTRVKKEELIKQKNEDKKVEETNKVSITSEKDNQDNAEKVEKQTSELTPYLLLAALSFHGLFEGIAVGLQKNSKSTISLLLAILAHKWAEALTLGLSFAKTGTEKTTFYKMITIFSLFTPIGIGLGIFLNGFPEWVTNSFMSLSVGTFIYIGAAEIIVEEFSISRFKWQKFCTYLAGGLFIAGLTIWEIAGEAEEEEDHDHEKRLLKVSTILGSLL